MRNPLYKILLAAGFFFMATSCNDNTRKAKKPNDKNPPVLSDTVPLPPVKNPDNN